MRWRYAHTEHEILRRTRLELDELGDHYVERAARYGRAGKSLDVLLDQFGEVHKVVYPLTTLRWADRLCRANINDDIRRFAAARHAVAATTLALEAGADVYANPALCFWSKLKDPEFWMPTAAAARILHLSERQVRNLATSGSINGSRPKPAGRWHLDPISVHQYKLRCA